MVARNAGTRGGIGDGAAVIAGGAAADSALPLFIGEAADRIGGAAQLEGADRLQGLELQQDLAAGQG